MTDEERAELTALSVGVQSVTKHYAPIILAAFKAVRTDERERLATLMEQRAERPDMPMVKALGREIAQGLARWLREGGR